MYVTVLHSSKTDVTLYVCIIHVLVEYVHYYCYLILVSLTAMCYLGPMKISLVKLQDLGILCYWRMFIRKSFTVEFAILPFYIHGHISRILHYANYTMHHYDTAFRSIHDAFAGILRHFLPMLLNVWLWRIRQLWMWCSNFSLKEYSRWCLPYLCVWSYPVISLR